MCTSVLTHPGIRKNIKCVWNLDAPEFVEKPKIVQKDGGKILGIKAHAKSKEDPTITWLKDDKPVVENDRVKGSKKKVDGKPDEYLLMLEIKVKSSSVTFIHSEAYLIGNFRDLQKRMKETTNVW